MSSDASDSDTDIDIQQQSHSTNYFSSDTSSLYNSTCEIRSKQVFIQNTSQSSARPSKNNEMFGEDTLPIWIMYIISFVILVLACWYFTSNRSEPIQPVPRIDCPQFKELTKHFTNQDLVLWKSLKVGIENVLNGTPAKPSIFLLAYNDLKTTRNVMKKILNATAECMQSKNPILLDGKSFATDEMIHDYGEFIAKYKGRLENNGILYVSDLNKTPSEVAQVFHTICDTITPLVNRAVIFFTIYIEQLNQDIEPKELLHVVEENLKHNWHKGNKITEDTLSALIARVTDQVFLLRSEYQ